MPPVWDLSQDGANWIRRFEELGKAGVVDRSKKPRSVRSPTPDFVEQLVLGVRKEHPAWGGRKIRARLLHQENKSGGGYQACRKFCSPG